jgi:uncharacterized protein (TIGR02145 family)
MKKTNIFSMLTIVALMATSMLVFNSCEENTPDEKGKVTFSFSQVENKNLKTTKKAEEEPNPSAVLVTIKDVAGETVYENKKITLYNMSGSYISEPISLLTKNDYKLTKYIVLNGEDEAIYATPVENSEYAYLVENPLPNEFNVVKDEATKITPEVLSTEEINPEEFGYATFSLNIVETFDFLVGVFVYDDAEENFVMTSANMTIESEGETLYTDTLAANTNTITVNDGYDNYILTVEKEGYQTHVDTFTNEELKSYYSSEDNGPLEIVLKQGEEQFTCGETFVDPRDGQTYATVKIGDQCWMQENLNYNQNSYGDDWCYDNDTSNCETYGRLYNWEAVMQGESSSNSNPSGVQGVCPDGWHVPSDEEWIELVSVLGGGGINAGSKLAGNASLWRDGKLTSNSEFDKSGFTALPGGYRDPDGPFYYIDRNASWWSSTVSSSSNAWFWGLFWVSADVTRSDYDKGFGMSVRCVRD